MKGNYIWTALGDRGTVGMGGKTEPGILHAPSGGQNFPTPYDQFDYLTPGDPFEFFSVKTTETGVRSNNNDGDADFTTDSLTPSIAGYDQGATWTGTYQNGGTPYYQVINKQYFNNNDQLINITTTIKALSNLTAVKFACGVDPDSGANTPGGTNRSTNVRGIGSISGTNAISSTGGSSGLFLGMITDGVVKDKDGNFIAVTTNTNVSPDWSIDPDDYLTGSVSNRTGDDVIGLAFNLGNMNAGDKVTFTYSYVSQYIAGLIESVKKALGVTDAAPPPPEVAPSSCWCCYNKCNWRSCRKCHRQCCWWGS